MIEITKPCPFCGTPARCEDGEHEKNMRTVMTSEGFIIECIMCGARGSKHNGTEDEAVTEWNNAKWVGWSFDETEKRIRDDE